MTEFLKAWLEYGLIFHDKNIFWFAFSLFVFELLLIGVLIYLKKNPGRSSDIKKIRSTAIILWILIGIIFLLLYGVVFSFPNVKIIIPY